MTPPTSVLWVISGDTILSTSCSPSRVAAAASVAFVARISSSTGTPAAARIFFASCSAIAPFGKGGRFVGTGGSAQRGVAHPPAQRLPAGGPLTPPPPGPHHPHPP